MRNNRLFSLSVIPLVNGAIVAAILTYVSVHTYPDYVLIAWGQLIGDLVPIYFASVVFFVFLNFLYILRHRDGTYDVRRNIIYNVGGLFLALIAVASLLIL